MSGSLLRRGERSWRLKWTIPGPTGQKTVYATVRGNKRQAQAELVRRMADVANGIIVEPDKVTIGDYLQKWFAGQTALSPTTRERYGELIRDQILPHLGPVLIQRLRPQQIHDWQQTLLKSGGAKGQGLSARTIGDARKVLRGALTQAHRLELIARNPLDAVPSLPVKVEEVVILDPDQIALLQEKLRDHPMYSLIMFALGTGLRRGEICGLAWKNLDLDKATVRVEHSLEQTRAGLRLKEPKTRAGRRTISLPASVVPIMQAHRQRQLELRLLLGIGRPGPDEPVFMREWGEGWKPDDLSRQWGRVIRQHGLPGVPFHALRHSHASACIAAKLDVAAVAHRLGHSSAVVTLRVYAHKFERTNDATAAAAIDAALFR